MHSIPWRSVMGPCVSHTRRALMPRCCCHLIVLWFGFQLSNSICIYLWQGYHQGSDSMALPCLLCSIILLMRALGSWWCSEWEPCNVLCVSFPGSFEFWRSFEYWGCRASFAWQGESVVYLRQVVLNKHTSCTQQFPASPFRVVELLLEAVEWLMVSATSYSNKKHFLWESKLHTAVLVTICWDCGP